MAADIYRAQKAAPMTYEEFLDEVATLLTEIHDLDDAAAIKLVVDAQAADYFVAHDDKEEMRTVEQAKLDAVALFQAKHFLFKIGRAHV